MVVVVLVVVIWHLVVILELGIRAMVFHKTQEVEEVVLLFSVVERTPQMILWSQVEVEVELISVQTAVELQPSQELQILELVVFQDLEAHKLRVVQAAELVFMDKA